MASERLDDYDSIMSDKIVGAFNKLIPEFSATLGAALGTWLKNRATIAIARDFRTDSRMMKRAFTAGLMSTGVGALDFHDVPTPVLQFYIRRFGADGGVMFTSSHYEGNKTGIRLFDETGAELSPAQIAEIREIASSNKIQRVPPSEMRDISDARGAIDVYIAAIMNIIDQKTIADKEFRIVIDSALGPVSNVLPSILTSLNVDLIAINSFNPKIIPKNLPNSESLVSLASTVKANNADLGVAFDVEGSRVVICDENGVIRSADRIAAGLVSRVVQQNKGTIVLSESMSKSIDNVVNNFGDGHHQIERIHEQPGAFAQSIRLHQAMFAASDSGSYWTPAFTVDSDGMYTTLKLLELLGSQERTLSRYLDTLPHYPNYHREINVQNNHENRLFYYLEFEHNYSKDTHFRYTIDTLSGTKIVFKEGWVNVMQGSTDSKTIHLDAEAEPFNRTQTLMDAVLSKINQFIEQP